jgi:hypothetical protein
MAKIGLMLNLLGWFALLGVAELFWNWFKILIELW